MNKYLPIGDREFDSWTDQFCSFAAAHAPELGLTADDLAELDEFRSQWIGCFAKSQAAYVAWKASVAGKNTARDAFGALIRSLVPRIQAYPTTTDGHRAALGITIRSASTQGAELPMDERPTAHIDITAPMEHVVLIRRKTPTGERRGKPAGALGCEIYRKVGDMPAGPSEMEFVMLATQSRVKLQYSAADGGKKVHYMMRYVNSRGDKGPWGAVQSATVAA